MKYRIRFFIGMGNSDNLSRMGAIRKADAFRYCADIFKGYTVYNTEGGWISPTDELCQEPSMVIEVYSDTCSREDLVKPTANYFKSLFNQECVMVTVDTVTQEFYL